MSNPSYRPEGRIADGCINATCPHDHVEDFPDCSICRHNEETGRYFTDAELTAMDAAFAKEKERADLNHAELVAIYELTACVAECPEPGEEDTLTVRDVKATFCAYNRALKELQAKGIDIQRLTLLNEVQEKAHKIARYEDKARLQAKDAEIERLTKALRGEEAQTWGLRERIRELEEAAAKPVHHGCVERMKEIQAANAFAVKEARAAMKEEAAKECKPWCDVFCDAVNEAEGSSHDCMKCREAWAIRERIRALKEE